jgi:hypothetical protein
MEDNHYTVDKLEIINQQEIRVGNSIFEIEEKSNVSPVLFLKSNFENKKIRERATDPDLKMIIGTMLIKICTLSGIKNEIDSLTAQDIVKMILSTYSDLTIEEIHKAFELERYGSYEDKTEHFQLFNSDYISKILKKYKNWKQKTKSLHNIEFNSKNQLPELTESQKETILINGVNRVYQEYQSTKIIEDPCEYIFDFLIQKGKIKNNSNPKVLEYYQTKLQQAKEQLKNEQSKKSSANALERRKFAEELKEIIEGYSPKIIIRAKKNILVEFFDKQITLYKSKIV